MTLRFWAAPIVVATTLLVFGELRYPALHSDAVAHALPGMQYARTGKLESPTWHDTYLFSKQGDAQFNYHGYLYPVLLGRLGCTNVPKLLFVFGVGNALSVLLFAYVVWRLVKQKGAPTVASGHAILTGLSCMVLASWLLLTQGRPEPLAVLIALFATGLSFSTEQPRLIGAILGIGAALIVVTSPVSAATFTVCSAIALFLRLDWPAIRTSAGWFLVALLACIALATQTLFPGDPFDLVRGLRAHSALRTGGHSLRMLPPIWLFAPEIPGALLVMVIGAGVGVVTIGTAAIGGARRAAAFGALAIAAGLLYWSALAFSPRSYNAIIIVLASLATICVAGHTLNRAVRFACVGVLLIGSMGFANQVRECVSYVRDGVKFEKLTSEVDRLSSQLQPGERIGLFEYSKITWTGFNNFSDALTFYELGQAVRAGRPPVESPGRIAAIRFKFIIVEEPFSDPTAGVYRLRSDLGGHEGVRDYNVYVYELRDP